MFEQLPQPERKRWSASLVLSFAAQFAVLGALGYQAAPLFVTPSDAQLGIPGSSGSLSIVYVAPVGAEQPTPEDDKSRLTLQAVARRPKPPKPQPKHEEAATVADN